MKNTNVTGSTIARTIVLVIALFNQVMAVAGKGTIDIAENDVYQLVTLVVTIGSAGIAWWKNNSFTKNAQEADEVLRELNEIDGGTK